MTFVIILLGNIAAGLLISIFTLLSTPKKILKETLPSYFLLIFLPSIGLGVWYHLKHSLMGKKRLERPVYYVFRYMGVVHLILICTTIAMGLLIDPEGTLILLGLFLYFSVMTVGVYLIIAILVLLVITILPAFIAKAFLKTNFGNDDLLLDDETGDSIINDEYWNRAETPKDADEVPYDVDDEYIPLDEDDENFSIDLD